MMMEHQSPPTAVENGREKSPSESENESTTMSETHSEQNVVLEGGELIDVNNPTNENQDAPRAKAHSAKTRRRSFHASIVLEKIQNNWLLNAAWLIFKVAPPVLCMVGLALSIYALADFASFTKEYNQLKEDVDQQSQQDFDTISSTFREVSKLILSVGWETDSCEDRDSDSVLKDFTQLIALMKQLKESPKRVSLALLPPGAVWKDYFVERFPSIDHLGDNLSDYSNFANPTRFTSVTIYGIPDMEPLFRTFRASLVFDVVSVVLVAVLPLIRWNKKGLENTPRFNVGILGVDCMFFVVSLALLLVTVDLASSTDGYGVDVVRGKATFYEAVMRNKHFKEGLNVDYWGKIPEQFCKDELQCFPENSYQPGRTFAQIDVTVPQTYLVQDGDRWHMDLDVSGTSIVEGGIARAFGFVYQSDEEFLKAVHDSFALPIALPQEVKEILLYYKKHVLTSGCPLGEQEFLVPDTDLGDVAFPLNDPDYNHICNSQCLHDWVNHPTFNCQSGSRCEFGGISNSSTCAANCPTIDTAETCGCLSFGTGLWNFNCTSKLPVITDENYNMFTSFAVENVQSGLVYDIAATAIDFVAICLIAVSIFVPSVHKLLNKDQEQNAKQSASTKTVLSTWRGKLFRTSTQNLSASTVNAEPEPDLEVHQC